MTTTEQHDTHFDAADALLAQVLDHGPDRGPFTADERRRIVKAHNERAQHDLKFFGRTMTQGDWLTITRQLDMSREQIGEDQNLVLLAFAFVKERRAHGSASLEVLLDLTDRQLLAFHGFAHDPDDEDDDAQGDQGDRGE